MVTKILIAEDGAVSRRLLRRLLDDWGYQVTEVKDGMAALSELQSEDAPSLAILDWMMPGLNGPEVVQRLRNAKPDSYTYVLLLTGKTHKSDILLGLNSGADDYLTKPFDPQELQARLRVGERIIDLQKRLVCALSAAEFRASHDALTGLYNRGTIMSLLEREAARCEREGVALGAILADVDHFKAINDTYGHNTGDEVLHEIAARMRSSLRSYDFLGRYGGEEFLIIAPGCEAKDTLEIAERLRQSVANHPLRIVDVNIKVTVSLGASIASPQENVSALLKRADLALYSAKEDGRNTFKFRPHAQGEAILNTEPVS
ncbi:MAG TPA: diguanylate cyclase [Candidatus Angelobacter sp.]|nr:diguanylate cyclase [Candidatus Angelobacter sp.]